MCFFLLIRLPTRSTLTATLVPYTSLSRSQVVVIAEAYEDAPALDAGIDRGARISAIGTSSGNMRSISSIVASQGTAGIIDALGPDTAGGTRVLRVTDAAGTRKLSVTTAAYDIHPIPHPHENGRAHR